MARVLGEKGTINEGAIGDVMEFDPTTGSSAEEDYELGPEPAHTELQLADAIVRGDLLSHPLDQAAAEAFDLEDRALDVVLAGEGAKKGDHVVADKKGKPKAFPVAAVPAGNAKAKPPAAPAKAEEAKKAEPKD
jgi:hypothetical protein